MLGPERRPICGTSAARTAAVRNVHLSSASSIVSGIERQRGTWPWAGILGRVAALAILAIAYSIAAKLGLRLAFVHASATAVWPPTGIALAAVLVRG